MATAAEKHVSDLELKIKVSIEEIERIENVVTDIDSEIATAYETESQLNGEIKTRQKAVNLLAGLIEIGRATDQQKAEHQAAGDELAALLAQQKPDTDRIIKSLKSKQSNIALVLEGEREALAELERQYPDAVRAVKLEQADAELKEFMKLSKKIAESVVRLAVLNSELDQAIFYANSAFALPLPLIEPFKSQAEKTHYHRDDCGYATGIYFGHNMTLGDEIETAIAEALA